MIHLPLSTLPDEGLDRYIKTRSVVYPRNCLLLFHWKARIDRSGGICVDLQDCAMVVRKVSVLVHSMICHKLDNLQNAIGAVYVRDFDVCFLLLVELCDVLEQTVGEDRRRGRVLDRSRDGPWTVGGGFGPGFRVLRQFIS
jgi:hypothetical protein